MVTKKEKGFAWLRAIRLQFVIAYVILGIGGLIVGSSILGNKINIPFTVLSFAIIIISAIGVHYRDEASDWIEGYDKEIGGVGVIREGLLEPKPLQNIGRTLNIIAMLLAGLQIYFVRQLLYIVFPIIIVIIGANYLTEKLSLGHELGPAFAFTMAFIWVYMGEGWIVTSGIIWFAVFLFIFVFALVPYQDVGDYEGDKKSGKKTLTVRMGIDKVGQFSIIIALISLIILYISISILLGS